MPDNGRFPEDEFEKRLEDLGAHVEYPPTPDLASNVRERIEAEDRRRSSAPGWIAAAVILLLFLPILAGLVMSGGGGGSMAGGGGGASGGGDSPQSGGSAPESEEVGERAPEPSTMMEETAAGAGSLAESATGSAATRPFGEGLEFGEHLSLREARARSDGRLLMPTASGLERPDAIYAGAPRTEEYTLVYEGRNGLPALNNMGIGLLLIQSSGGVESFFEDGAAANLEEVRVNGTPGYWAPDGAGTISPVDDTEELSGGVLVWERDGRAFRLQANIGREKAIRIAESVR